MSNRFIIDSHCHIQFPVYDNDREKVIERAKNVGVKIVAGGTQISTSKKAIELAHQYPEDIWATVGFHPSHATLRQAQGESWHHDSNEQKEKAPEKFDINQLRSLAQDSKVVAIGECGLDYFRLVENGKEKVKSIQKEVFKKMVDLAVELNKPLVIHCRPSFVKTSEGKAIDSDDAYLDLLDLIEKNNRLSFKILHCFSGSLEITKKMVEAGFYFTLGGAITFPAKGDRKKGAYDEIIRYIPIEKIMIETDAPYLAPVPYRGQRNEPAFVIEVAKKIAEIKKLNLDELLQMIYTNFSAVFKIK